MILPVLEADDSSELQAETEAVAAEVVGAVARSEGEVEQINQQQQKTSHTLPHHIAQHVIIYHFEGSKVILKSIRVQLTLGKIAITIKLLVQF